MPNLDWPKVRFDDGSVLDLRGEHVCRPIRCLPLVEDPIDAQARIIRRKGQEGRGLGLGIRE